MNGKKAPKVIYGTQALQHQFKMLHDKAEEKQLTLLDLRPVKQFKWLLETQQKCMFTSWLRSALPQHGGAAPSIKDKAQKEGDHTSIVLVEHGGAPSSSADFVKKKRNII